jgi:hypothetical protein
MKLRKKIGAASYRNGYQTNLYQINMKLHQYKGHPASRGALYIDAASYKNGIRR